MLHRISASDVRLGMYVHSLEGSWLQHPFWRRRFLVGSEAELATLRASEIAFVVIDDARGLGPVCEPVVAPPPTDAPAAPPIAPAAANERERAAEIIGRSKETMRRVFVDARLGHAVQSADVLAVVDEISGSVQRNAHALIGMVRLKNKDEYTYLHSVAVCALMINLARQLGLPDTMSRDFGMAGLVHDIGKMEIPSTILNKPSQLTDDEFAVVRSHPEQGNVMLQRSADIPDLARDVCLHHHEKVDGTGYPFGLKGEEISLAARMGAICDVYDALTSDRIYKGAWTPVDAVTAMAGWEGQFDRELLLAFCQSIGIFPVGMLVRLKSGVLAVALPNGRRSTRPRLRIFYDSIAGELSTPRDVTLSEHDRDAIASEANPADFAIHDWTALREHLTGEFDRLDPVRIERLWFGEPAHVDAIDASGDRVTAWRPTRHLG